MKCEDVAQSADCYHCEQQCTAGSQIYWLLPQAYVSLCPWPYQYTYSYKGNTWCYGFLLSLDHVGLSPDICRCTCNTLCICHHPAAVGPWSSQRDILPGCSTLTIHSVLSLMFREGHICLADDFANPGMEWLLLQYCHQGVFPSPKTTCVHSVQSYRLLVLHWLWMNLWIPRETLLCIRIKTQTKEDTAKCCVTTLLCWCQIDVYSLIE